MSSQIIAPFLDTYVKYSIVWQLTPSGGSKPGRGYIILAASSDSVPGKTNHKIAQASLVWTKWQPKFSCVYSEDTGTYTDFQPTSMNDKMKQDVQSNGSDVEGSEKWQGFQPELEYCGPDSSGNQVLKMVVQGGFNRGTASHGIPGTHLWAKMAGGEEEVEFTPAEQQKFIDDYEHHGDSNDEEV